MTDIFQEYPPNIEIVDRIYRDRPFPLYYQVKQLLMAEIQKGLYDQDNSFPTEQELQDKYQVSRITVRRALSDLANEGVVSRQPGRGTFLLIPKVYQYLNKVTGAFPDLDSQGYNYESIILKFGLVPIPAIAANKLCLHEGQLVLQLSRLVKINGKPIFVNNGYHNLPDNITFRQEEIETKSIFDLLIHKYGINLREDRTIEARLANKGQADLLHVPLNSAILFCDTVYSDHQGNVVSYVKVIYPGDRYKFRISNIE
jgi:DNA-binding GntR family transcriptional regulator